MQLISVVVPRKHSAIEAAQLQGGVAVVAEAAAVGDAHDEAEAAAEARDEQGEDHPAALGHPARHAPRCARLRALRSQLCVAWYVAFHGPCAVSYGVVCVMLLRRNIHKP